MIVERVVRLSIITLASTFALLPTLSAQTTMGQVRAEDGLLINYATAGLENPGPGVVFVHGWSNNWSFAEPRFSRFAQSRPVVALDLPGFGDSGADRSLWDMGSFARDVRTVVDHLALDTVLLVGHSMGGAVVLAAALEMPDRVAGVVTIDWLQDPHQKYDDAFFRDYKANYESGYQDLEWVRGVAFSPTTPERHVQRYIDNMPDDVPDRWWMILWSAFSWASEELVSTLDRLEAPLLAVNTDAVPTDAEAYGNLVHSFQHVAIEGLGHIGILWEEPDVLDRHLVEFIESVAR